MRFYDVSFFIKGKIQAELGVNALKIAGGGQESPFMDGITLFYPDGQREKYHRIAAAINAIMAETDAEPVTLTDATEAARDALVLAVPDVGFGNDRALVTMENLRRAGWKLTEAGNVAVIAPAISEAAE